MAMRTLMILVLCGGVLSACHTPRGAILGYTGGSYTYFSTEQMPKTFRLVDTRTEEVIFIEEIPAGKQLTIQFIKGEGNDPVNTPDLMMYEVMPINTRIGTLRNSMTVPNAACRRIDIDFRPAPEAAPEPAGQIYRPDRLNDGNEWMTPEGGEIPEERSGHIYDD